MPGFWRKCRLLLRWLRFAAWGVLLALILGVAWLNLVGLPDFLKSQLVATLRERGVELEFSRMRLRFIHGLVAENIRVGEKNNSDRPALTASEVQLRLNYTALLHRRFQVDGVVLRDGKFTLPVSPTNALVLLNMKGEIRFLPDEIWSLDELRADFAGAHLRLAGRVAHAPEMAGWKSFAGKKTGVRGALSRPLKDFADTLAQIHLSGEPQLGVTVEGDARDVHSFTLRVNGVAPGVGTPWFSARGLEVAATLTAPAEAPTNGDVALDFWTNAQPFRLSWTARASDLRFQKINAGAVECAGLWSAPELAVTKFSASPGGGKLTAAAHLDVTTRALFFTNESNFDPHVLAALLPDAANNALAKILWTQPPLFRAAGEATLPSWTNPAPGWRAVLTSTARLTGELAFTNAVLHGATVEFAHTHFNFGRGIWSLPDLEFAQGRTRLEFSGEASAATENFSARLRGALDTETVRPFLPGDSAPHTLSIAQFTEPLVLDVTAQGNFRAPDALTAAGHLALTNFAIRGQTVESFAAEIVCTNRVLLVLRPELFRAAGSQTLTAGAAAFDLNAKMIFFTNVFSTFEPTIATRAIGSKTARIIAPYEYLAPPTVRAHGRLPLGDLKSGHDLDGTDLTFEIIRGAPFRWTMLNATNITGTIHWLGQELELTNIAARCYGGEATGHAYFDFRPTNYDCDFNFGVTATNLDMRLLAADLSKTKTNRLEGFLSGWAEITRGDSRARETWNGYGSVRLEDGLLWNIPVFGFVSPVLNKVTPGLGNSRATEAKADFVMTNGVARTDSLAIHTRTMRLQYAGTVDLWQNVDAHVTAQLMRNMPVVGSLVSTVLWPVSKIFECQVTGLVSDPKVKPVYIPFSRYLAAPLHPIRTLEGIFSTPENPVAPGNN